MLNPEELNEPICDVCKIPKLFAVSMIHVGDNKYLCDKCIEAEKNSTALGKMLANFYDKLQKEEEKKVVGPHKFWD